MNDYYMTLYTKSVLLMGYHMTCRRNLQRCLVYDRPSVVREM